MGRVPALDPFTFTSGDRPWIDLHWLFQLILAGSYALGGVPGIILLASSLACGCAILVGLTSREAPLADVDDRALLAAGAGRDERSVRPATRVVVAHWPWRSIWRS